MNLDKDFDYKVTGTFYAVIIPKQHTPNNQEIEAGSFNKELALEILKKQKSDFWYGKIGDIFFIILFSVIFLPLGIGLFVYWYLKGAFQVPYFSVKNNVTRPIYEYELSDAKKWGLTIEKIEHNEEISEEFENNTEINIEKEHEQAIQRIEKGEITIQDLIAIRDHLKEEDLTSEEFKQKLDEIQDKTRKHLNSFTDDYEDWIDLIKDSKNLKNILSEEFSIYQDAYYTTFKEDGMMAYLFTRSFEKGYLCAEYIINQDKYLNNISIDANSNESFHNASIKLIELEDNGENLLSILDDFFYLLVENDSGSYERNIAEEHREDIWEFSKKQMIMGMLTRFTELKLLYKLNGNDNILTGIKMSREKYPELSFQKTLEYLKS